MQTAESRAGIVFGNRIAFYVGCAAIAGGVLLHLPMFISSASMGFHLAGMPIDPEMVVGMGLIVLGLVAAVYGIWPSPEMRRADVDANAVSVAALDDARISTAQWSLVGVLSLALIIDVMKPATLGFVVPGMISEYHISKATVAWLPLVALLGTTIGSLTWGWLGDRIGRRATILLAALFFMGTAICGSMPGFTWNVVMCFLMGLSAGGLLPIAFSLLSEFVPARHRASLIVLLAGLGTAGGYLAASGAATLLEPHYGWRIMWFLNLPTGLLLILLNRYIPESPRFLVVSGRFDEARALVKRFGAVLVRGEESRARQRWERERAVRTGLAPLFRSPYVAQTAAISLYGLAWGLVNFGFLLWLPTNLRHAGFGVGASDAILAKSALLAVPGALLVAWLYSSWSTKGTMLVVSALTALSLIALSVLAPFALTHNVVLVGFVVGLLVFSSGMTSVLSPYSAEVYPTRLRATGSGVAAGSGKFGGMAGQAATLAHLAPGLSTAGLIVAAPVLLSILALAAVGIETRGRRLEEIQLEPNRAAVPASSAVSQ
jgi:MFS transporter, putative metabolite:H+ symporter